MQKWLDRTIGFWGAELIGEEWLRWTRLEQYPIKEDAIEGGAPARWLVTGGRGSGKTRLGAEWVNGLVRSLPPFARKGHRYEHFALVGETVADVREVMVEGPSGILAVCRENRPRYEPSRRRVVWPTGAVAHVFSSEDPESLRGPQFDAAWCDELGKWKNAEAVWDMLQFGLRLGPRPMLIVTTTPRPTKLMKRLLADPQVVRKKISTEKNKANLATGFVEGLAARYGRSTLGRQELYGELIEDRDDALWKREQIGSDRQSFVRADLPCQCAGSH